MVTFQSPNDIVFTIFGFPVYFYGVILALAVFIGFYTADFLYRKFYGNNADKILDFVPWLILIGILGARFYYCILNFPYYYQMPENILNIREGGLSIHGMIIAGVLALYVFAKRYKLSFLKLSDVFLCASALAQSIGRWGNFFNSEAFGKPTDLPWKLFIPVNSRPPQFVNYEYFHPAFLYESILDFVLFLILIFIFKKCSAKPGLIACIYLVLYSLIRIFTEQIRIDSALNVGEIPIAQIISAVMIFIGVVGITLIMRKKAKT